MSTNEEDIQEISKKTRLLEKNQKAYYGDTSVMLKKQNETVQLLVKENEALSNELQNNQKLRSVKHNIQHQNHVGQLQEQIELLERRSQIEESKVADYSEEIRKAREGIMLSRRSMGGVNVNKDNSLMVEKQVKILENRLDQALCKFNDALAQNKELREQIDNLRRERVVFDSIYKKLERELHEKKKQMADIIEQSNLFYEERDMASNELQSLKIAAEKDMLQYEEHFRELEIMVEADKQLKESLKQAAKFKPNSPPRKNHDLNTTTDEKRMNKSLKGGTGTLDMSVKLEEDIEQIMEQLMEATGIDDTQELLERFVKAEEQNFSMYNYVNDLHQTCETMEEEITTLREDYVKQKGVGDAARHKTLKDLEDRLAACERHTEEYEEKTVKAEECINELRNLVEGTFSKLGCGLDEMNEVMGSTQCTDTNMMTFLGLIEQRATEMLAKYTQAQARNDRRNQKGLSANDSDDDEEPPQRMKFLGNGPSVPYGKGAGRLSVMIGQLPSTGDNFGNDGDDAEDDRVLTQAELRAQTEARLAARDELRSKGGDPKRHRRARKKTAVFE
mmetsp:Transcript_6470/g.11578  ORF Transcript_6470/g.11578 Transcript_6470/m.11578 type:complete len:562 (-) Transcript_6470:93-1778(-)